MFRQFNILFMAIILTLVFLNFSAPRPAHAASLVARARCQGDDLIITIINGEEPLYIEGVGPGIYEGFATVLPSIPVDNGRIVFSGPGIWVNLAVFEQSGDYEWVDLGNEIICGTPTGVPLNATATCDGDNFVINIIDGDKPFAIWAGRAAHSMSSVNVEKGVYTYVGPDMFGASIAEGSGDLEYLNLGLFTCPVEEPIPYIMAKDTVVLTEPGGSPTQMTIPAGQAILVVEFRATQNGYYGQLACTGGWIPLVNTVSPTLGEQQRTKHAIPRRC